jgi:hypothetical protein
MISFRKLKNQKGRLIAYDGQGEPLFLYEDSETNKSKFVEGENLFPAVSDTPDRILVSGPSGSGKSTWVGNYLAEYRVRFPKNKIFIFSSIQEDSPLDRHKPVRIDLGELSDEGTELDPEYLRDSCVVFDDVDTIAEKKQRDAVLSIRDFLLEQSRHFSIHLVCTTHVLLNYRCTRRLLNEATGVVLFPKSGNAYQITQFLKQYIGMSKKEIDYFLRGDPSSRWRMVVKTFPIYVLSENECYLV